MKLRPKGVIAIASFFFLRVVLAIVCIAIFGLIDFDPYLSGIALAECIASLLAGVGLWKLKNWARIFAVLLTLTDILGSLALMYRSPVTNESLGLRLSLATDLLMWALNVAILVYLLLPKTRNAFSAVGPGATMS
jgi:hypothetical protein